MHDKTNPTKKQLFTEAAVLIKDYGFIKEQFGDHRLGFCTSGAIHMVCTSQRIVSDSEYISVKNQLLNFLSEKFLHGESVTVWNDDPKRTQLSVIRMLRKAARACEE